MSQILTQRQNQTADGQTHMPQNKISLKENLQPLCQSLYVSYMYAEPGKVTEVILVTSKTN